MVERSRRRRDMNDMTTTRMLMTTAVLAAVAALLAGPAHAVPVDPDGGTGIVVVTAPAMGQVEQSLGLTGDSALTRQQSTPTDVHGALYGDRSSQAGAAPTIEPGPQQSLGLTGDSALTRVGLSEQAAATGQAASSGSDTDWTWIGVGGGMAALLAAALAGLYFSARNRDRVALP
jgi:hypothetical protein